MVFPKSFERLYKYAFAASLVSTSMFGLSAQAADPSQVATALRIAGTVTGGTLSPSSPDFAQIVSAVEAGDYYGAALAATRTNEFAKYLARRLARQMQNPGMDGSIVNDNDATTFLVAHFIGSATGASVSSIWSENATYLVNVTRAGTPTTVHVRDLTAAELAAVDWRTALVRQAGQTAKNQANAAVTIPAKHVGGYVTLSDRTGDASIAEYGATAGTNLRYIETIYQVAFGLSMPEFASSDAREQDSPKFVPLGDPNFFRGQGQAACISCHGGGLQSLNHGYSTLADIFDFNNNGFTYIAAPVTNTMKSYGSDPGKRGNTATCNFTTFKVCNPDSLGADPNQNWDVSATWKDSGLLTRIGWKGALSGSGLNALGAAIGQASGVYTFLTKRVFNEVCPLGSLRDNEIAAIAAAGQASDDLRTIVARVASHQSCR